MQRFAQLSAFCTEIALHSPDAFNIQRTVCNDERIERKRKLYQFKDEVLFIEMPELVPRSSLGSDRISRADRLTPWLSRVPRCDAQEGRCPVDCVDDRFQQTAALELVGRNFANGGRRARTTGTTPTGRRCPATRMDRARELHAAARRRRRRRVRH